MRQSTPNGGLQILSLIYNECNMFGNWTLIFKSKSKMPDRKDEMDRF